MALRQLLAAIRRHFLIVLIGVAAIVLAAGVVHRWPAVYQTRVDAILLNPLPAGADPATVSNPFQGASPSLISTAGVVARMLDQGTSATSIGSDVATLAGQGVRRGYSVTLPNSGGQWVYRFDRAVLDVQVVGGSEREVESLLATAMAQIRMALEQRETSAEVPKDQWIRVHQSPAAPLISRGVGDRKRAVAVTLVLGLGMTLAAVLLAGDDRRRRRPAGQPPARAMSASAAS